MGLQDQTCLIAGSINPALQVQPLKVHEHNDHNVQLLSRNQHTACKQVIMTTMIACMKCCQLVTRTGAPKRLLRHIYKHLHGKHQFTLHGNFQVLDTSWISVWVAGALQLCRYRGGWRLELINIADGASCR